MNTQSIHIESTMLAETAQTAVLSNCGRYRYWLTRAWNAALPTVNWIMLNPSTADAMKDDPTIRRCISFAKAWGCGGIIVTNLFALRSPDPAVLYHDADPVGPENDGAIISAAAQAKIHVAAWGVHSPLQNREHAVLWMMTRSPFRLPIKCLGVTKNGHPRHPLYVLGETPLIPMEIK